MEGFGLTRPAVRAVSSMLADHRRTLPPTGRRTRRVYPPGGGALQIKIGKADADIAQGDSGTISIWDGDTPDALTDTDEDVTAYARMEDVEEGDWVYVAEFPSGWEVLADELGAGDEASDGSGGCCGPCIDRINMLIDDQFARVYSVSGIPDALQPAGGLRVEHISNLIWESDTFDFSCASASALHYWRMEITGTGTFKEVSLRLIHADSGSVCVEADPGTLLYVNLPDFRGRCGNTLNLNLPQELHEALDALPCTVCISPVAMAEVEPASACWTNYISSSGRAEPFYETLFATVESISIIAAPDLSTPLNVGDKLLLNWSDVSQSWIMDAAIRLFDVGDNGTSYANKSLDFRLEVTCQSNSPLLKLYSLPVGGVTIPRWLEVTFPWLIYGTLRSTDAMNVSADHDNWNHAATLKPVVMYYFGSPAELAAIGIRITEP